ncbi:MAG: glycosyltransferase [Bacilli bacterium]|jgi:glycosyltransferase involved in cell wall biosynthesis|nr:glycosyltransferase [Bacilli bacterium]
MKIVFVIDCYGIPKNGTTSSARRFAEELRKRGHEVKILGVDSLEGEKITDPDFIPVKPFVFPLFQNLIVKEGFCFACPEVEKLYKAIKWADVVHLYLAFPLEIKARVIAEYLGKTVTSAFHMQPDSATYAIHMDKWKFLNWSIYRAFYEKMYRYTSHVHCPSQMIADVLKKEKYNNCHPWVISNGVIDYFHPLKVEKPAELKEKYIVLMVGRLAREKRQDIIIKAISKSKYNQKIQLILCGEGPNRKALQKLADKKLANPVIMGFQDHPHLRDIINYSDLYVHASDSEIEGMACTEAFSCGLVPVISDSKLSATNSFALDPHCLFKRNDAQDLADKIDYFIEHPKEKALLSERYVYYSKNFALHKEVDRFEEFLKDAIKEHEEKQDAYTLHPTPKERRRIKKAAKQIAALHLEQEKAA